MRPIFNNSKEGFRSNPSAHSVPHQTNYLKVHARTFDTIKVE